MTLPPGTRVGVYEIGVVLGEGGMGQVYQATDTTLGRQVAIKILPDLFANDAGWLARFEREAKTLASLNHPHIAAVYGFERSNGTHALVMELVDGEDLSRRIARGPLPFVEALPIARQIAEALEAAHDQGIVHRDLKPANIKVRDDGTVKVLDFGLATAVASSGSAPALSMSPAITTPAMTHAGVILGTAAYLSPEQARGRVVDKRTDVWAFGCVLFEMLTGQRAFEGEDVTDTIAAIERGEPDWSKLPAEIPDQVNLLLRRCVEKDWRSRIGDIDTARFLLTETITSAPSPAPPARASGMLPWSITAAATLGAIAVLAMWAPWHATPAPPITQFTFPAESLTLNSPFTDIATSPNGRHIVYMSGTNIAASTLKLRSLDRLDAVELRGTTGGYAPFFSADGQSVGYFSEPGELRRVPVAGGPPTTIGKAGAGRGTGDAMSLGADWGVDGSIVYATANAETGLMIVPSTGGEPSVLTTPDAQQGEADHANPAWLPGGRAMVFTIIYTKAGVAPSIAVLDVKTRQYKVVVRGGSHARYIPSGHLVYFADGAVRAVRFDLGKLEVVGESIGVVDHVLRKGSGAAEFSVSANGTLSYLPGLDASQRASSTGAQRMLVWVDRQGHEQPLRAPPRAYQRGAISPDGKRIALDVRDQENDVWIWDAAHETLTRLTTNPGADTYPVWTADGKRVIYQSADGESQLHWQLADGTGAAEPLTKAGPLVPLALVPGGRGLLVRQTLNSSDISLMGFDREHTITPLVNSNFNELNATVSPDGHWLAYDAQDSGQNEIYVRPFPKVNNGRWQVSTGGGHMPAWAPNGRELYFLDADDRMRAVPVKPSATVFEFGSPTKLFGHKYYIAQPTRNYDVAPDGRFLMIKDETTNGALSASGNVISNIVVVQNWIEEVKSRLPAR